MKAITEVIAGLLGFFGLVSVYVAILMRSIWPAIVGGVLFLIALYLVLVVTFSPRKYN